MTNLRQVKPIQPFLDSNKTTSSLDQIFSDFLELDAGDGKVSPNTLKN